MNPFTLFAAKLSILFSRNRFHSELDEEMAFHRAQVENDFSPQGCLLKLPASCLHANSATLPNCVNRATPWLRFAGKASCRICDSQLRQLRHNLGFALTAIFILALGMGVSVAIFGFVDAALLQPLPYSAPNRLVDVAENSAIVPAHQPLACGLRRLEASQSLLQLTRCLHREWLSAAHAIRIRARSRRARNRWLLSHTRGQADARSRFSPW